MNSIGAAAARAAGVPSRILGFAGAVLVLGGLALVGTAFLSPPPPATAPPYELRPAALEPEPALVELAAFAPKARLEAEEVVASATGRAVATGWWLRNGRAPPVLLAWKSTLGEPILHPDTDPAEELRLVRALRRHLSEGARILALPERSRRLARLAGVTAPLAGADDTAGLRLVEPWLAAEAAIRAAERARLGSPPDPVGAAAFEAFQDALLSPVEEGVARLQVLAGGGEAYLVLHLLDAFTLGLLRPQAVAIGLHDMPGGAAIHDSVRLVKSWIREQGHAAYATLPRTAGVLRVFFLARSEDTRLLLAHVLPFDTADLGALPALRLVFQSGGYWIWRLEPVVSASENS